MPVMLLPEDYDAWLGSTTAPEDLRNLLRPYDESLMEAYAVSRKVKQREERHGRMHRTHQ
jgi:putative SOS response-associated peptidase YedK